MDRVASGAPVEEYVDLHPMRFAYSLTARETVKIEAIFDGGNLAIVVPAHLAEEWASGDEVGIETEDGAEVKILIEKDFACVKPRSDEDEADMFEHPDPAAC